MNKAAFVMITTSYPGVGDGREAAGSFVADLAEEIGRSMPVRVVAPGNENVVEGTGALRIFRYRAPDKPLSTLRPWRAGDLVSLLSVLSSGKSATEAAVSAGPVARLLALWALPSGHWARHAARRHEIPYSVWTLGSDVWSLGRIPIVRSHLARVLAEAEVCYSDGLKLAEDTRRIGGREVVFLPSTRRIDSKRTAPLRSQPPYRLSFLGRWHYNKGIDLLLEALRLLNEDDWRAIESVNIYGGGPLQELVSGKVARLRAEGRPVQSHGYVDKITAGAVIAATDYLLVPSRIESIPVVFSDAMKLGCPVVATPVGDFPQLLAAGTSCGIMAERTDAKCYSDALRVALRSSPHLYRDGTSAMATRFDLALIARDLAGTQLA